jgi:heterodisulfide reductase subunit B
MNVAYYPGCSLHGLAREYDISTRLVYSHLGINLKEILDWNCCGATAAHSLNHELTVRLNARNLAIARDMKLSQIVAPCAGCYSRLKTASYELRNNKSLAKKIENLINTPAPVQPEVSNAVQLLIETKGTDAIAEKVVKPLKNMKLAAYYGCLLTRPHHITEFDDPEQPMSMDLILRALGAETVNWSHKAECCGGGYAASETPIVVDLGNQVLESARREGAEALVVACPMCQTNLDGRQLTIEADLGVKYNLPIIYFTQLMGLAFGYKASQLGFKKLLISPFPLLKTKGLV